MKPDAGIETLPADVALRLAGQEPDYHIKDLFNAIEKGDYPSWTFFVQVIEPQDAPSAPIDIFDNTFTWPHEQYPLRPVGRLTLNKNVSSQYAMSTLALTICESPTTTSKTLSKLHSHLLTWFLVLGLLPILVCNK